MVCYSEFTSLPFIDGMYVWAVLGILNQLWIIGKKMNIIINYCKQIKISLCR